VDLRDSTIELIPPKQRRAATRQIVAFRGTIRRAGRHGMTGSPAGMNSAIWMRHDIERELQRVDWADVGIRLTAYATWKARNLH
jgi:hypothetical protein